MPQVIAAAATQLTAWAFGITASEAAAGVAFSAEAGSLTAISATFYATEAVLAVGALVGVAMIASLLAPKPPNTAQQTPLKQSIPPRRFGYGRARLGGYFMLYESYRDEAQDVIYICEGPIDAFERWFLNDDEVQVEVAEEGGEYHVISPDGQKYGPDGNHVYLDFRYGAATETYYNHIFDNLPPEIWTADCRGDGCTSMAWRYVQGHPQDQSKFFPNGPPQPSVACRLLPTYDPRINGLTSQGVLADWSWNENPVCALIDYLTSTEHGMGLPFEQFILPHIADFKAAADICAEQITVADYSATMSAASLTGTSTVTLRSVTGLAAGASLVVGYGSSDIETKIVLSILGDQVTLTTPLAHDHPQGDECRWAANGAVAEDRYRIGGAWDFATDPAEVIAEILGSCDGWLGQTGDGGFRFFAGKYQAPTVTFTDDHILGYTVQHFQTDEEAINQLIVNYTDPNYKFNNADAGTWDDLADQTARGRLRSKTLGLPKVPSRGQARRLAKRLMNRYAQELRGTVKTNLYGMNGLGERYIRLQISENQSLVDIVVEVQKVAIDLASLSLTFTWVAADADIDAWTIAEETGNGSSVVVPGSPRIPNTILEAPTITAAEVIFSSLNTTGLGARILTTIASPLAAGTDWVLQWRAVGGTDWTGQDYTGVPEGLIVTLLTGFVMSGVGIELRAAYVTAGGQSDWSSVFSIAVPLAPANTAILDETGVAILDELGVVLEADV